MNLPKAPVRPVKPIEPKKDQMETFELSYSLDDPFRNYLSHLSLEEILSLRLDKDSYDDYTYHFVGEKRIDNKNYEKQYAKYLVQFEKYKIKKAQYDLAMVQYKKDLAKYEEEQENKKIEEATELLKKHGIIK